MSDIKVTPPGSQRPAADPSPRLPRRTSVSRHGAISRELTKYSNYKSWAEKVKGVFAPEGDTPGTNGTHHGRRSADR